MTMQMLAETSSGCHVSLLSNLLAVENNYPVPFLNSRNNLTRKYILWEPVLVCNNSHMVKSLFPLIKLNSVLQLHSNVTGDIFSFFAVMLEIL